MTPTEMLVWNLEEVRRRSIKIWNAIPSDQLHWKPDADAMTCIEMVRHVLEGEHLYLLMLESGGSLPSEDSPFTGRPYASVAEELQFSEPYRLEVVNFVRSLSAADLETLKVDRSDKGYVRSAGDFILRMAYHESVHGGQLLSYLRTMNATRPNIWD
jgi:uncharacterized damage-inducible protein DinB